MCTPKLSSTHCAHEALVRTYAWSLRAHNNSRTICCLDAREYAILNCHSFRRTLQNIGGQLESAAEIDTYHISTLSKSFLTMHQGEIGNVIYFLKLDFCNSC